jgi:hypothetical protein
MKNYLRHPRFWVILLAVILYLAWSANFIFRTSFIALDGQRYFSLFDDAMISMRYAWNFSHGHGLVWNPGEYVEGYTNLLMTLVMTVATGLLSKSNAALAIQAAGIPTVLGAAWLTRQIARRLYADKPWVADVAFLGALFYFPLSFWTLMGMETGLVTILLLAGFLCVLEWLETRRPAQLALTALFLGLMFLARNDSLLFAALVFGYLLYRWRSPQNTAELRWIVGALCLYGLFIIGQEAFRLWYYGALVPNTYTLKVTGIPLSVKLRWGLAFIQPFVLQSGWILAFAALETLRTRFRNAIGLLFLAVALAYQVSVGGDAWKEWRILAPGMPGIFILAAAFFVRAGEGLAARLKTPEWTANGLALALLLVNLVTLDGPFSEYIASPEENLQSYLNRHTTNVALALNALTTPEASIGVFWGGTLPYYADRRAIDFLGKSDKYIANLPAHLDMPLPGHNKFDLAYSIRKLTPTYIQDFERGKENLKPWVMKYYIRVNYATRYGDITLILRRADPSVDWTKGTLIPWPGQTP